MGKLPLHFARARMNPRGVRSFVIPYDEEILLERLLERVMGIEPTHSAWKADALPLSHTRKSV